MRLLSTLAMLAVGLGLPAAASSTAPGDSSLASIETYRYETALRASQQAVNRTVTDWPLTDSDGRALRFAEFRGKPLVLSLVYTSCHAVCPTTTRHLAKAVETARDTLGAESFQVALLGFDSANDSPLAMQQYAKRQGVDAAGWQLLSADPDTVQGLTDELGFTWFTSPNGFDHMAQVTIIDADGTIYRQVYGESFATPSLVEPLLELVLNRRHDQTPFVDDLINRVRLFCTSYDPVRDAYYFDYSLFLGMLIGGLIIIGTAVYMVREFLAGRRYHRV